MHWRATFKMMIALAVVLNLTGCQGSSEGKSMTIEATSQRIVRTFRRDSGRDLVARSLPRKVRSFMHLPRVEMLSLEADAQRPTHWTGRYGQFEILVCEDRAARDQTLSRGKASADGIRWHEVSNEVGRTVEEREPYWVAEKTYGETVILRWVSESGKRRTSAQWKRLDSLLRDALGLA